MKVRVLLALLTMTIATAAVAGDDKAPVNKPDGSSLSSGQKENMPTTKNTGENQPVGGSAASGASEGTSGSSAPAPAPAPNNAAPQENANPESK